MPQFPRERVHVFHFHFKTTTTTCEYQLPLGVMTQNGRLKIKFWHKRSTLTCNLNSPCYGRGFATLFGCAGTLQFEGFSGKYFHQKWQSTWMYNAGYTALFITLFKWCYAINHNLLMLIIYIYFSSVTSTIFKHWRYRAGGNYFGALWRARVNCRLGYSVDVIHFDYAFTCDVYLQKQSHMCYWWLVNPYL